MELYRYDDSALYGSGFEVRKFEVIKETPKGYWILEKWEYSFQTDMDDEENKRWVSKNGRKRYAHPTKKEALQYYQYRKRSQIRHLEARLHWARKALTKANEESDIEIIPYSDAEELGKLRYKEYSNSHQYHWHPWKDDFLSEDDMNL